MKDQVFPSTSAASRKRTLPQGSPIQLPTKLQRVQCDDCGISVSSGEWFPHCRESKYLTNVKDSLGNRVKLLKSTFRCRICAYRFPNLDGTLNIVKYLQEGEKLFKKLIDNSMAEHIIIKINLEMTARYKLPAHPLKPETDMYHITEMMRLSRSDDIKAALKHQMEGIKNKMSEFQERDSGWTLIEVKWLDIYISKSSPLKGS